MIENQSVHSPDSTFIWTDYAKEIYSEHHIRWNIDLTLASYTRAIREHVDIYPNTTSNGYCPSIEYDDQHGSSSVNIHLTPNDEVIMVRFPRWCFHPNATTFSEFTNDVIGTTMSFLWTTIWKSIDIAFQTAPAKCNEIKVFMQCCEIGQVKNNVVSQLGKWLPYHSSIENDLGSTIPKFNNVYAKSPVSMQLNSDNGGMIVEYRIIIVATKGTISESVRDYLSSSDVEDEYAESKPGIISGFNKKRNNSRATKVNKTTTTTPPIKPTTKSSNGRNNINTDRFAKWKNAIRIYSGFSTCLESSVLGTSSVTNARSQLNPANTFGLESNPYNGVLWQIYNIAPTGMAPTIVMYTEPSSSSSSPSHQYDSSIYHKNTNKDRVVTYDEAIIDKYPFITRDKEYARRYHHTQDDILSHHPYAINKKATTWSIEFKDPTKVLFIRQEDWNASYANTRMLLDYQLFWTDPILMAANLISSRNMLPSNTPGFLQSSIDNNNNNNNNKGDNMNNNNNGDLLFRLQFEINGQLSSSTTTTTSSSSSNVSLFPTLSSSNLSITPLHQHNTYKIRIHKEQMIMKCLSEHMKKYTDPIKWNTSIAPMMCQKFLTKRFQPHSTFLSSQMKAIAGAYWKGELDEINIGISEMSYDTIISTVPSSVFSTLIQSTANSIYTLMKVPRSCVSSILLLLVARECSYSTHESLHYNVMFVGDKSTGKSTILKTFDRLSIPGTVSVISRATPQANSVGEDDIDFINIIHEVDLKKFARIRKPFLTSTRGGEGGGSNHQGGSAVNEATEAYIKDQLDRCRSRVQRYTNGKMVETEKKLTGNRYNSSNTDVEVSEPYKDRHMWLHVNRQPESSINKKYININDSMMEETPNANHHHHHHHHHHINANLFIRSCWTIQGAAATIVKQMEDHILPYPTLLCTKWLISRVESILGEMKDQYSPASSGRIVYELKERQKIRIQLYAAQLVIKTALASAYGNDKSPLLGKNFRVHELVPNIIPWLKDSEEIAIFALSSHQEESHPEIVNSIIKVLRNIILSSDEFVNQKRMREKIEHTSAANKYSTITDPNYIVIESGLNEIINTVYDSFVRDGTNVPMKSHVISHLMDLFETEVMDIPRRAMSKNDVCIFNNTINGRGRLDGGRGPSDIFEFIKYDKSAKPKHFKLMISETSSSHKYNERQSKSKHSVCFHISILENIDTTTSTCAKIPINVMKYAISKAMSHTKTISRTVLYGQPIVPLKKRNDGDNSPYNPYEYYETMTLVPDMKYKAKMIEIPEFIKYTSRMKTTVAPQQNVDMELMYDLDTIATKEHMFTSGFAWDVEETLDIYHPVPRKLRELQVATNTFNTTPLNNKIETPQQQQQQHISPNDNNGSHSKKRILECNAVDDYNTPMIIDNNNNLLPQQDTYKRHRTKEQELPTTVFNVDDDVINVD